MFLYAQADLPAITVSIPPQAYFIHRITGPDRFDINIMIPNGQSPAVYSPKPSQMMKMNRSEAFFLIGHPAFIFEKKHINPFLKKKEIPTFNLYEEASKAAYPAEADDPHLWMSPVLSTKILDDLAHFLSDFYPEDSLLFMRNAEMRTERITSIQDSIEDLIRENDIQKFFIYHPSWGYFARDFNLTQIAIESHGHEPGPGYLTQITHQIHEQDEQTIIIQKGFSRKSAEALAQETDAVLAEVDPLAYDWVKSIKTMITILTQQ